MPEEYYKTKESVEEYINLAKDVDSSQLIEKFAHVLAEKSTLLEIGSGPGTDWKSLSKLYNVTGSDFSTDFLYYLRSNNPEGEFLELDAISLKTDKTFDGIYSNKVLHHLKDDELITSVKNQYSILQPTGVICHSFWKGEGSEVFKGMFVNYHTQFSLEKNFSTYFDILSIEEYKEFDDNDSFVLIGRKK